jgi:O-antigen biosynthesis protein
VSVICPNYNGSALLGRYLTTLVDAAAERGRGSEVILVDDASTDDSVAIVKSNYPSVHLIHRDANGGFQAACNSGAQAAAQPLLFFVNNDMRLDHAALDALAGNFDADVVFAVAARSLVETFGTGGSMRGGPWNESITKGALRRGWLELEYPGVIPGKNTSETFAARRPVLYAPGGAVMCRADRFRELGGFDPIYAPYLFEDLDLCFRAWKRGWTVMYEPQAVVYHEHSATIGRTSPRNVRRVAATNQFVFHWKNLTGTAFRAHCLWLAPRLAYWLVTGKPAYLAGFWRARGKLSQVRARRIVERSVARLSDEEVLRQSSA